MKWNRAGVKKPLTQPLNRFLEKNGRSLIAAGYLLTLILAAPANAFAADDMWTVGNNLIVDVYNHIAGISTVLAALMSAVAVLGAKMSNNQHKVDQAWEWLRRIWVAWIIINGIGAFIAYIVPQFNGLGNIDPYKGTGT